jgi:hypothetical protein
MPVEKEEEKVETTKETTWYECDVDECDVRSQWREDLNFIVVNPGRRRLVTQPATNPDGLSWDGVMILCDEHLEEFQQMASEKFGVAFHEGQGLVLDPRKDSFGSGMAPR